MSMTVGSKILSLKTTHIFFTLVQVSSWYSWASASRIPASRILVWYWTKKDAGLRQLILIPDQFRHR
jgi:hypothetical protein